MKKILLAILCFVAMNAQAQNTTTITLFADTTISSNVIISQNTIIDANGFKIMFGADNFYQINGKAILLIKNAAPGSELYSSHVHVIECGTYEHYDSRGNKGSFTISNPDCHSFLNTTHYLDGTLK
jgi:hypothetical protein